MSSNQRVYHNNMYKMYMYNISIGIAQMNAFSCANKKEISGKATLWQGILT